MTRAARGNDALLGISIDQLVADAASIGHPYHLIAPVTAPSAPTSATGASGAITATRVHYVAYLTYSGETTKSTGSTGLALVAQHATVTVPTSSNSETWGRKLYFSDDAGTTISALPGGIIYDNTTTTYDDNCATDDARIDTAQTPRTYNESGANGGYLFLWPESVTMDPDYKQIASKELKGSIGHARGAPGDIDINLGFKKAFETGFAVPITAAILGKPSTITRNADGTNSYAWTPSSTRNNAVSVSFLHYPGGMRPEQFICAPFSEIDCDVKSGALVDISPKGMATHHSKSGIAKWVSTPNASYKTAPIVRGIRADAAATSGDLYIKVTTAPSGGSFKIKCKVTSGASYGSSTVTIYYDTTTKKQIQSGAMTSDWAELLDSSSGDFYGADTNEARRPFSIMFPGDCSTLALNDELYFPAQDNARIPGLGTTPGTDDGTYTGFAPRTLAMPRFTASHAYLFRGASLVAGPSTYEPNLSYKWKLSWALKAARQTGAEAAIATEFDRNDFAAFQVDFTRRFINRYFQGIQEQDMRLGIRTQLIGEKPLVQLGLRSTSRLLYQIDALQMRVDKAATPISGPNVEDETVSFVAEQPDDLSIEPFTVTCLDGPKHRWNFRA